MLRLAGAMNNGGARVLPIKSRAGDFYTCAFHAPVPLFINPLRGRRAPNTN